MCRATSKLWAGWCDIAVLVQWTCLKLMGFVSESTDFWGARSNQPVP